MHRLFLDANVLFTAAHRPNGKAAFLFEAQADAGASSPWTLVSSAYAIEEARRNIEIKAPDALARLAKLVGTLTIAAQPSIPDATIRLPDMDVPIWSAAHACGATHLLTVDVEDFGRWMNRPSATGGIVIQTVAEFLASR